MNLPSTVPDLIALLDKKYPAACIGPTETVESAHRRAGQREVVEFLLHLLASSETRELERHKAFR